MSDDKEYHAMDIANLAAALAWCVGTLEVLEVDTQYPRKVLDKYTKGESEDE